MHVKPRKPRKARKARKPQEPRDYIKKVENKDGSITYTKKTPDGKLVEVTYKDGYPDFSPYKYDGTLGKSEVEITMTGDNTIDFKRANAEAGFGAGKYSHPEGCIWHHHQDSKTMQLIKGDAHNTFPTRVVHPVLDLAEAADVHQFPASQQTSSKIASGSG